MKAENLFQSLDNEFEIDKIDEDEWGIFDLGEYVTESFRRTRKGLILDFTSEVERVYTAVFPSESVLDKILESDVKDALLFTHHPMIWDSTTGGFPFTNIPMQYVSELKERRISYYAIHVPLDKNGPYSTTASLAHALEIEKESEFFEHYGVKVGIIGKTKCESIFDLSNHVKVTVGHQLKIWANGPSTIDNGKVALVAGGGNYPEIAEELAETDIRTYITGVTMQNPDYEPSLRFHEICRKHEINVIAATHYSTEKFACIEIQKFFEDRGLPSEFVEDAPAFSDY